jgi:hypothetical protein
MPAGKCTESLLVYGISGSGKTTQVQELSKYVYKKTGKKTRLVSMSGGGWTSIMPAVSAGLVDPCYIRSRDKAVETLQRFSMGWWPIDVEDPTSPLAPPEKQQNWKDVGAIAYDGITEGCEWLMSYMVGNEAAGKMKISQLSANFKDGETNFGTPSLAHYGNVQSRIADFVGFSKAIRDVYIMWTALELKATDDNSRLPLYGPDISGKAKTAIAGAWFDNTLHLYITGQGGLKKGTSIRRLYLSTHFEDDQIPFVAKNRGHFYSPLPEYLEGEKCSLAVFLELLEESHKKATERFMSEINK